MAHNVIGNNGGPPVWWWLFGACVLLIMASHFFLLLRRKLLFPAFAQQLGLAVWPSDSLPGDIPLQAASFHPVTKVFNIAAGTMAGVPVITFDAVKRAGRSATYFTVLGARSAGFPFGAEMFDPDLKSERLGEWFLLYRPQRMFAVGTRLMPFEQIAAQLRSVRVQA